METAIFYQGAILVKLVKTILYIVYGKFIRYQENLAKNVLYYGNSFILSNTTPFKISKNNVLYHLWKICMI